MISYGSPSPGGKEREGSQRYIYHLLSYQLLFRRFHPIRRQNAQRKYLNAGNRRESRRGFGAW